MDSANHLRVLLVENDRNEAEQIKSLLQETTQISFEIETVPQLKDLYRVIEYQQFNVILICFSLLNVSGRKIVEKIRETAPAVPIVVMVHLEDQFIASMVEELGVDDYVIKNYVSQQTLSHTIHSVIQHRRMVFSLTRLLNKHAALYDELTGLPNRSLLLDRMNQAVMISKRNHERCAVLLIDIDDTHIMNEEIGRENVDKILRETGKRLSHSIHSPDTVARFTGDKFIVLLTNIQDSTQPAKTAQIIQRVISEPVKIDQQPQFISASIGVAIYPEDGFDTKRILNHAEDALSESKQQGVGKINFHDQTIQLEVNKQLELEKDLRLAWAKGEFAIFHQPQIAVRGGSTASVEAVIRWQHPDDGLMDDESFFKLADETGLLMPLGDWLIRSICNQYRNWVNLGVSRTKIAFTISDQQFSQPTFWDKFYQMLLENNVPAESLILQFYESTIMRDSDYAIDTLTRLKNLGFTLAINDFGSEQCVMGFVRHLPIDILKLQARLLKYITINDAECEYAKAAIALGHSLGKQIMACGVDTPAVQQFIVEQGCHYIQGTLYTNAVSPEESSKFLGREWPVQAASAVSR